MRRNSCAASDEAFYARGRIAHARPTGHRTLGPLDGAKGAVDERPLRGHQHPDPDVEANLVCLYNLDEKFLGIGAPQRPARKLSRGLARQLALVQGSAQLVTGKHRRTRQLLWLWTTEGQLFSKGRSDLPFTYITPEHHHWYRNTDYLQTVTHIASWLGGFLRRARTTAVGPSFAGLCNRWESLSRTTVVVDCAPLAEPARVCRECPPRSAAFDPLASESALCSARIQPRVDDAEQCRRARAIQDRGLILPRWPHRVPVAIGHSARISLILRALTSVSHGRGHRSESCTAHHSLSAEQVTASEKYR